MAQSVASCQVTPEFRARMAVAEKKIRAKVVGDLNHYGVQLASNLRAAAPKDTNALRAGIHPIPATEANLTVTIKSNANYSTWVNEGTRAHFPPVEALIGWSRRHKWPGTVDSKASRKAFATKQIAYKLHVAHHGAGPKKHYAAMKKPTVHVKKGAVTKGKGGERTVEAQAFLIARAISRRGGKKQNFIEPVMKPAKLEIIKICQNSLSAVRI